MPPAANGTPGEGEADLYFLRRGRRRQQYGRRPGRRGIQRSSRPLHLFRRLRARRHLHAAPWSRQPGAALLGLSGFRTSRSCRRRRRRRGERRPAEPPSLPGDRLRLLQLRRQLCSGPSAAARTATSVGVLRGVRGVVHCSAAAWRWSTIVRPAAADADLFQLRPAAAAAAAAVAAISSPSAAAATAAAVQPPPSPTPSVAAAAPAAHGDDRGQHLPRRDRRHHGRPPPHDQDQLRAVFARGPQPPAARGPRRRRPCLSLRGGLRLRYNNRMQRYRNKSHYDSDSDRNNNNNNQALRTQQQFLVRGRRVGPHRGRRPRRRRPQRPRYRLRRRDFCRCCQIQRH